MKISEVEFPFILHNESEYNGYADQLTFYNVGNIYYADKISFLHRMGGLEQNITIKTEKVKGSTVLSYYNKYIKGLYRYEKGLFSSKFKRRKFRQIFEAREVTLNA